MSRNKSLLIIDLEATCFEDHDKPENFISEIIEFGCVLHDTNENKNIDEYCTFSKPVLFPVLSEFCTKLTTITQEDVKDAPLIEAALKQVFDWVETHQSSQPVFASWGDYDKNKITNTCRANRVHCPLGDDHINLKKEFFVFYQDKFPKSKKYSRPFGLAKALDFLKIPLEGTHHRGIDDAKNMSKIVSRMIQDGWTHPFI